MMPARGKFASVKHCRHRATGVEYAAKMMRKRRRAADVRHEIVHEIHVLEMSLHHPNIVQLSEVYESPSEIYLVLELMIDDIGKALHILLKLWTPGHSYGTTKSQLMEI
ncbi:unnamed protein product [Larinioides sclopetarius]|uniref:Protein kinase domain-containing protein n=1 Tax=Larinioides sclopetarius TaxID=280406 RepID=A0AAV1Z6J9_9ARAC